MPLTEGDPAEQAPVLKKVVLAGREFDLPTEAADALIVERDKYAGEYGSRLQALQAYEAQLAAERERVAQQSAPQDDGLPHAPDPKDLERDPEKYARENLAWTEYLVASSAQQVEGQRRHEQQVAAQETARAAEWSKQVTHFYDANPDLKADADIVDAVWRANFAQIKEMKVAEGFDYLAKLSKERILRLSDRGKARRSPRLEHTAAAPYFDPNEPEDVSAEQFGIGKYVKAKQARMRAGAR